MQDISVHQLKLNQSPLSDDASLQEHVKWYVDQGYEVRSQAETSAQLVKPKRFSLVWALLWALPGFVFVLVYVVYYLSKKDETAFLYVEDGIVKRS